MDDLFQVIVFAIILLLGLLSGGRRKGKQRPAQRPRPRQEVRPRRPAPPAPPPAPARATTAPRAAPPAPTRPPRRDLEETLLDLLQGRFPAEIEVRELPEERGLSVEAPPAVEEAVSLERLDLSDEERHASFHERIAAAPPTPSPAPAPQPAPLTGGAATLRQALIWQAILGPPKGLE